MINADLFTAELLSPLVSPTSFGIYCLSFDFFLHCGSTDNLFVYTVNLEGVKRQEWYKSCGQIIEWQHVDVQLTKYIVPFQVSLCLVICFEYL